MRIYVSSTSEDLREFRAAVVQQLTRLDHKVVSMEGYTADARGPVEKCLADVASAEAYVGLFAFHYGSVPSGHELSITEMEFRKAGDRGLPRLIFLVPEDVESWPVRFVDRGEAGVRMEKFRRALLEQVGFTAKFFKNETELLTAVPQAIQAVTHPALPFLPSPTTPMDTFHNLVRPLSFDAESSKHLPHFTGREWVEDRVDDWIAKQRDSKVFCLLGGPGIGKSAIACHWCHTRKDVIAFHHCVHGHAEKTDPKRILLSLAAQIAAHLPEYEKRLSALDSNELKETVKGDTRTVFDNLLLKPFGGDFPIPSRVQLVVIDGLDEASRGQDNELASFIGEVWGGLPDWLRLVVTSRPEMDVIGYLGSLHPFILNASSRENLQDIRTFLRRELDGQNASDDDINQIVAKSEGMFLYAYLVLEEIRARRLSLQQIAEFPEGLTGYYKGWFGRKFSNLEGYHRELHDLVSVIIAQKAPLPLSVLSNTLGLSQWELSQRLMKLGVLFPLREERQGTDRVTFVTPMHKSLHDWLTEVNPATLHPRAGAFAANPELGNQLLAEEGWKVYSMGKLAKDPYFNQTLLFHLFEAKQTEKLAAVLLDPTLLDTLWSNEFRYDWQRHISSLSRTLSLTDLVQDCIKAHSLPPARTSHDAAVFGKLGRLFQELGAFDEAMLLVEAALQIWQENNVTDSPDMVSSLLAMGSIQSVREERDRATASYEKALSIAQRAYVHDSPQMADVLYQLCIFYTKCTRDYEKAWDCLEKSLAIRSCGNPPDFAGMANCINDKAVLLIAEDRSADYLAIYQEALALFEKARPAGHPEMVAVLGNMSQELRKADKKADAVKVLRRAVAMAKNILLPQHEYSSFVRRELTATLLAMGQYDEALEVMRDQIIELERFPGPDHEDTAQARLSLCQALWNTVYLSDAARQGNYREEARHQCQRIRHAKPATVLGLLDLAEDSRLIADPVLHDCFMETARRSCREDPAKPGGNLSESSSAKCFADILETLISSKPLSDLAPHVCALWEGAEPLMKHQADCLPKTRKLILSLISWSGRTRLIRDDDVEGIHQAFDLITKIGADSLEALDHLATLAIALQRKREYAVSESLCERVLAMSERLLGAEHTETLKCVSNLAWLREYRGRLEEAQRLFSRAYEASCRVLGSEQTDTIGRVSSLIACLLRNKDSQAANALFREFSENLPQSESPTSARSILAVCLNRMAIGLKDEFAEYQAARVCYEFSIEMNPRAATTFCNLALLLWSCLGDFPEAGLRFEQALKLNPSSGHIHSTYAMFLTHTLRDCQRALDHFEKSMSLSSTEAHLPGNFATWCILTGDLSKGWQLAKRSMKLGLPSPDRVMARPLFCAASILILRQQDPSIPLGQMKTLFSRGIDHVAWIITALLKELDRLVPPDKAKLLRAITEAIAYKKQLHVLETDPMWQAIQPVPLEAQWPGESGSSGSLARPRGVAGLFGVDPGTLQS